MLDRAALADFAAFAHGEQLVTGCVVRNVRDARHAASTAQRVTVALLVLVALPVAILALAQVGIVWIGAIFVIAPAVALGYRNLTGLSGQPKMLHAIVTERLLLLIDASREGEAPVVDHAYSRVTLAEIRVKAGRLTMTSTGSPIKLLADPDDAQQLAALLPAPPVPS